MYPQSMSRAKIRKISSSFFSSKNFHFYKYRCILHRHVCEMSLENCKISVSFAFIIIFSLHGLNKF